MNKNNAKALSTLRQKIRKYNRDYENEIVSYKEVGFSWDFPQDLNIFKKLSPNTEGCFKLFNNIIIKIALLIMGICANIKWSVMRIFCFC